MYPLHRPAGCTDLQLVHACTAPVAEQQPQLLLAAVHRGHTRNDFQAGHVELRQAEALAGAGAVQRQLLQQARQLHALQLLRRQVLRRACRQPEHRQLEQPHAVVEVSDVRLGLGRSVRHACCQEGRQARDARHQITRLLVMLLPD